ncbi:L-xylulose reductase-like isoform X4 [Photinus pyralis]|uniref:L-xylulose reductase-like isoform X3 n=1 Tax=Photinus pyralis TaxID=7054 RepID=UPI0012672D91|nr:L-xylulose reductase-like isoform X3 [Photinus pyralis]XP_031354214.1 L-xylulose reductase-like isoform X4 [Photinus pyralis]
MEISFTGKRALVSGIGRAIAIQLSKCGAEVIALGRNKDDLDSLAREGKSIKVISVDLADWELTRKTLGNIGDVDLLVNNAGFNILEPMINVTESHIDQLFAVNYKSVVNLTQIVTESLLRRKVGGSVVVVSSQASFRGIQDHAIYCSTKAALDAFVKVCALELGPHNIRVNCVNPTVVLTELGQKAWSDPAKAVPMKAKIPLNRFAEVSDVVDAVLFLLSDKASMITGTCLPVDGGTLAAL